MDADDWSYPYRLQKQYEFMEENPEVGIVGGAMELIDKNNKVVGIRSYEEEDINIRKKMFRFSPFSHPTIMINKKFLSRSGLYDSQYDPAEDYELYFRVGMYAKFANIKDVLIKYRLNSGSTTIRKAKGMELQTIAARKKYGSSQYYHMTKFDRIYNRLQLLSVYIVPPQFKLWLFMKMRDTKVK